MKSIPKILKAMFAVFFVLQIIFYTNLYANRVDATKLDQYLDKMELNRDNTFSLAIIEKGNSAYRRSIGFVDPAYTYRSNVDTRYKVGELSKTFTAVIIMQMIEEKRIQQGTPIFRFFPEIPNAKHISIKDLLSHRVNIMDYLPSGKLYHAVKSEYVFDELLKTCTTNTNEFKYSDPNYLVLGLIVEKMEGTSYNEVIKNRIADRIHLNNTFSAVDNSSLVPKNEMLGKWDLNSLKGSGSIVSTPSDIGKFMNALFYGELVNSKSLQTILSFDYGMPLGVNQFSIAGKQGYGYTGSMDGFTSQVFYFPQDSICISFSTRENNQVTLDELVKIIYES